MPTPSRRLKPRKSPVQARSMNTVKAIFEAAIQVLLKDGATRLTTTSVADRAGVSVGTLYQYFPNKESLLAAVLRQHLTTVVESIEHACTNASGNTAPAIAKQIVGTFFDAKFSDAAASRALYAIANDVDGLSIVSEMAERAKHALCVLLASCSSHRFENRAVIAYVWSTAIVGPVQGLLHSNASPDVVAEVQQEVTLMFASYLRRAGKPLLTSR
jgi:AcrR family transcriptional regulator